MDRFGEFLERMINVTHATYDFDRNKYVDLVREICESYNICKGVAEFYQNITME